MKAAKRGALGEQAVAKYLQKQGFEVIATNYHSRFGELDVVAAGKELLLFVEVKTRKVGSLVKPAEAVCGFKAKKLAKTAMVFLQSHPQFEELQPRFDVAEVIAEGNRLEINYIKSAFDMGVLKDGELWE